MSGEKNIEINFGVVAVNFKESGFYSSLKFAVDANWPAEASRIWTWVRESLQTHIAQIIKILKKI